MKTGCAACIAAYLALAGTLLARPDRANELYLENCASCHGSNARCGMGGSLSDGLWKLHALSNWDREECWMSPHPQTLRRMDGFIWLFPTSLRGRKCAPCSRSCAGAFASMSGRTRRLFSNQRRISTRLQDNTSERAWPSRAGIFISSSASAAGNWKRKTSLARMAKSTAFFPTDASRRTIPSLPTKPPFPASGATDTGIHRASPSTRATMPFTPPNTARAGAMNSTLSAKARTMAGRSFRTA